ncbi:hypothetical protein, partial [Streptomyces sp. NPDC048272]|uniref:hypothetical protein n=1 Tax=Streptomyces sp. NPDC048272 TaxID=3154616 RepID=UPI0034272FAB
SSAPLPRSRQPGGRRRCQAQWVRAPMAEVAVCWSATATPTNTRLKAGEQLPALKSDTRCLPAGKQQ